MKQIISFSPTSSSIAPDLVETKPIKNDYYYSSDEDLFDENEKPLRKRARITVEDEIITSSSFNNNDSIETNINYNLKNTHLIEASSSNFNISQSSRRVFFNDDDEYDFDLADLVQPAKSHIPQKDYENQINYDEDFAALCEQDEIELLYQKNLNLSAKNDISDLEKQHDDYIIIPQQPQIKKGYLYYSSTPSLIDVGDYSAHGILESGVQLYFPLRKINPIDTSSSSELNVFGLIGAENIYDMYADVQKVLDDKLISSLLNISSATNPCVQEISNSQLWVDKYRPQRYVELVGDETAAREVLAWIKEWDYCVFGRKSVGDSHFRRKFRSNANYSSQSQSTNLNGKSYNKDMQRNFSQPMKRYHHQQKNSGKNYQNGTSTGLSNSENSQIIVDPLQRPLKRILLISGPPGLGKTTLVQVAAKRAGYLVDEVNASDDRSVQFITNKLKTAYSSHTLTIDGKIESRPRILVIDEIDGAIAAGEGGVGFIQYLADFVKLIQPKGYNKTAKKSDRKNSNKQKQQQQLRPIICICNDAYTSATMRALRQVSQQVTLRRPVSYNTLVQRLSNVCANEGLKADQRALYFLAESSDGDIRACLNSLQFASSSQRLTKHKDSTLKITYSDLVSKLGLKDENRSLFAIWEAIFWSNPGAEAVRRREQQYQQRKNFPSYSSNESKKSSIEEIVEMLRAHSEFEKIAVGCHEHYPRMRFHSFERASQAMQTLQQFDEIGRKMPASNDYQARLLAHFNQLFASNNRPILEFPRADFEAYQKGREIIEEMQGLLNGIFGMKSWSKKTIALDLIAPLFHILSPNIKPTALNSNCGIIGEKQIDMFRERLKSFGLKFVRSIDDEETLMKYKLEPPIDKLCNWRDNGEKPRSFGPRNPAVRHFFSINDQKKTIEPIIRLDQRVYRPQIPSETRDLFGRVENHPLVLTDPNFRWRRGVQFRYNEGFSNAVRRPLSMCDLLNE